MEADEKSKSRWKQSFNPEPDVQRMLQRWEARNPMVIKSRMFNAALRSYLVRRRNGKVSA